MIESGVNGILVPPSDPDGIASALCSLLSDGFYAGRIAANARSDALERFTEDRMVAENLAVYDTVVHRESPESPRPARRTPVAAAR